MRSRRMRSSKSDVVAPVRLLAAALGVVLVDAPDGLVGEAQPELVDDQAEVAEVERAGQELEAVVPGLAIDEGQRVSVEGVHAVADRRAERDEAAQRDAVAGAVAAHDHLLGPRADVAAHELAASSGIRRRRTRPRWRTRVRRPVARPLHGPAVITGRDRLDARLDEHLRALALRGLEERLRPRPARAGPTDRHQPPEAHPVLEAGDRRLQRQAVALEPGPGGLDVVDEQALQPGVPARDPAARELERRRCPDQPAADRHRPADRGFALEHEDVGTGFTGRQRGRKPGHAAADNDHITGVAHN